MNSLPNRIVVYTKDVCNITGLRQRTSRKLLAAIRRAYNKPKGGFITVPEFSAYTGISEEIVRAFLL